MLDEVASRTRYRHVIVVYLLGLFTVGFAWILATPAGDAPDEPAHMIKALALGHGEVIGNQFGTPPPYLSLNLLSTRARRLLRADTRFFDVDGRDVPTPPCFGYVATVAGRSCHPQMLKSPQEPSYVGNFPPGGYVAMAAGARLGTSATSATLLARVSNWVACWCLLAFAVLALTRTAQNPQNHMVALAVAMTPSIWFIEGSANPSAIEISAAIAFAAGLIAVARGDGLSGWLIPANAVVGVLLAASRPMSWLWMLLIAALVLLARGRHLVDGLRPRYVWLGLPIVGVTVAIWWQRHFPSVGLQAPPLTTHTVIATWTRLAERHFPREYVGSFNWLINWLPSSAVDFWLVLSVAFLVTAAISGRRRIALVSASAAVFVIPGIMGYEALMLRSTGWDVAARYVFPTTCCVFLLAGEALDQRVSNTRQRPWQSTLFAATVAAQVVALMIDLGDPTADRYHDAFTPHGIVLAIAVLGWSAQTGAVVASNSSNRLMRGLSRCLEALAGRSENEMQAASVT